MAHIADVLLSYAAAKQAQKLKLYLLAARYYRVCTIYYDNTEQYYDSEVEAGEEAKHGYWKCRKKLSKDEIRMLNIEYHNQPDDWRQYIQEEFARIDLLENPKELTELFSEPCTILGTTISNGKEI